MEGKPILNRIAEARRGLDQARARLREAALAALEAGCTPASLSSASGLSPSTLKRLRPAGTDGRAHRAAPVRVQLHLVDLRIEVLSAEDLLEDLIRDADGMPSSAVSAAAGISRMTLWRAKQRSTSQTPPLWILWLRDGSEYADLTPIQVRALAPALTTLSDDVLDGWAKEPRPFRDEGTGTRLVPASSSRH